MKTHILLVAGVALGVSALANPAYAAPKSPKAPKVPKHHLAFQKADANADGFLDFVEFAKTQGPGTPMVEVRARFIPYDTAGAFAPVYQLDPVTGEPVLDPVTGEPVLAIDPVTGLPVQGEAITDGLVSFEEWDAYYTAKKKPQKVKLSKFELADFDGDGVLTPEEFGYLVSPKVKFVNVVRNFDKKDFDGDGSMTEDEYKGIKPAV